MYPLVVLFAGLTWSGAAALGVSVAAALTAIGMSLLESRGLLTPVEPVISSGAASAVITASVAMTAVMLVVALRVIRASSDEALANERKLRELEKDLARAQRMEALGKLAGGLAHDFNNMLTGIIGHAELVTLKASSDPVLKRHAQLILGTSERAAELTRQLLAFSRKREPFVGTVGLNQLVKNVVAILEGSVDPRIQVQAELRAEPDWVEGDAASLESAILNLAINGRDAMPDGGTLSIRTALENGSLRVDVSDTGTGIASGVIDKIFEPYFTTKAIGKGTGLGLAAVYGTTQEHGGTIEVESHEGQGTRFILRLPRASGPPPAKTPRNDALKEAGSETLRVLAVDDEPAVLESVSGMLSQLGHAVLPAMNASEALQILGSSEAVDVVLLDLVMPGLPATSDAGANPRASSRDTHPPHQRLLGRADEGATADRRALRIPSKALSPGGARESPRGRDRKALEARAPEDGRTARFPWRSRVGARWHGRRQDGLEVFRRPLHRSRLRRARSGRAPRPPDRELPRPHPSSRA